MNLAALIPSLGPLIGADGASYAMREPREIIIRKTDAEVRAAATARVAEIGASIEKRREVIMAMLKKASVDLTLEQVGERVERIARRGVRPFLRVRLSAELREFVGVAMALAAEQKMHEFIAFVAEHVRGDQELDLQSARLLFKTFDPLDTDGIASMDLGLGDIDEEPMGIPTALGRHGRREAGEMSLSDALALGA